MNKLIISVLAAAFIALPAQAIETPLGTHEIQATEGCIAEGHFIATWEITDDLDPSNSDNTAYYYACEADMAYWVEDNGCEGLQREGFWALGCDPVEEGTAGAQWVDADARRDAAYALPEDGATDGGELGDGGLSDEADCTGLEGTFLDAKSGDTNYYYLCTEDIATGAWEELNPCDGLQKEVSDCLDNGNDGEGNPILEPADYFFTWADALGAEDGTNDGAHPGCTTTRSRTFDVTNGAIAAEPTSTEYTAGCGLDDDIHGSDDDRGETYWTTARDAKAAGAPLTHSGSYGCHTVAPDYTGTCTDSDSYTLALPIE